MHIKAISSEATRAIFVPYIDAFGGVERLVLSLSRYLETSLVRHEIVCFRDSIGLDKYASWPMRVLQLNPRRSPFFEAQALRHYSRKAKWNRANCPLLFDLKGAFYGALSGLRSYSLHLTDPPSLLEFESSRASRAYQKYSGCQKIYPPMSRLRGEIVHAINRRGVRSSNPAIAMTQRVGSEVDQLYSVKPVIVRPGIAEIKLAQPPSSVGGLSDVSRILSVSRLERSKRLDSILFALADLGSNRPWRLDIVGSGPCLEELQALARKLNVSDSVHFAGRVPDNELENYYRSADIFVMPAVQGYGLPALEALERNLPVILHSESGVAEILDGSPWVSIIHSCSDLTAALRDMRRLITSGSMSTSARPRIPHENEWAAQIIKACGWQEIC